MWLREEAGRAGEPLASAAFELTEEKARRGRMKVNGRENRKRRMKEEEENKEKEMEERGRGRKRIRGIGGRMRLIARGVKGENKGK